MRPNIKSSDVVERNIKGAKGSLYNRYSDAARISMERLQDVLSGVGYLVRNKSPQEATLRVYPVEYPQYPLLNPHFVQNAAGLDESWDMECVAICVWSKGCGAALDRQLAKFRSTKGCAFFAKSRNCQGYYLHGYFVIPVTFKGTRANTEIDYRALCQPLSKILGFLKGCRV
jgi:hypothetical protein